MFRTIQAAVRRIPRGRVATYGQIARVAGYPGSARQVVWALRAASGLPWHRVVGAGGRILLTGEHSLEQRFRLEAEGVTFAGARVRMDLHQWKTGSLPQRTRRIRREKTSNRRGRRGTPRKL